MEDARASVAERAATAAFANAVIGSLVVEIQKKYKFWKNLSSESEDIKRSLTALALGMDEEVVKWGGAPRTAVARAYGEEMRCLTHDTEDCLERFLRRVTCKAGASRLYRTAHTLRSIPTGFRFAAEIKALKKRMQEARNRIFNPPGGSHPSSAPTARRPADAYTDSPVGIEEATEELLALLQQPNQLTLISIVGFGGSGKTTLARSVYTTISKQAFPHRAWVSVSSLEHSNALGILTDIHQQLLPQEKFSHSSLTEYLKRNQNRYIIIIDGIKDKHMGHWNTIRSTFKGSGAVLLTTTFQSVANQCISHSSQGNSDSPSEMIGKIKTCGYVYNMKTLSKENSQKVALLHRCSPELIQGSATLLEKCDGHPLALSCVAEHLSCQDEPTGQFCMELCSNLGSYMEWGRNDEPNFSRLRSVLFDSFTSLPDHFVRTCMLYLGIFPVDHPLRRNVIIRRWCAEGYTRSDPEGSDMKLADRYFKLMVDCNIIQPVAPSRNALVKTCKTHGIVHEFMLYKSVFENFIAMFDAKRRRTVRHLVVHHSNSTDSAMILNMDLSRARSLTVFGNGGAAISNFMNYKLIRVLDLEGCSDVRDYHLKDIFKLWNLRYLSLGPNITTIPDEISQLKLLETLDVSKTTVNVLPLVVIGLPGLVHLIGKFTLQIPEGCDSRKLEHMLVECKLETLTGFVADGSPGFLQLMVNMKKLKSVKIWCGFTGDGVGFNNALALAIPKFMEDCIAEGDARSLSLDLQAVPEGTLYALREIYNFCLQGNEINLTSLKMRGNLPKLPEFVPMLNGLSELCLSPARVTQDLMTELGKMEHLLYLKVTADQIERLIIHKEAFQSLRRLRFVVHPHNFILPKVQEGALPELVSLQLLGTSLIGMSDFEIKHLQSLKELVLHHGVGSETRAIWEEGSRKHPNRPNIVVI